MKKILGLDLGTTSIGWAFVHEDEKKTKSKIIDSGVRIVSLSTDEIKSFNNTKALTINAERTLKRSARRSNARYKLRRSDLIEYLTQNKFISNEDILAEDGKGTTHQLLKLRSKACQEKVSLIELARILLNLNKKRGYKSSRKVKNIEEGSLIDGMEIAKKLANKKITCGEYSYNILKSGKKKLPDYYRSDLINEFERIYNFQSKGHPKELTGKFKNEIVSNSNKATIYKFKTLIDISPTELKGKRDEKKLELYRLRAEALNRRKSLPEIALILAEINKDISKSSGYLGEISDRSKELYFNEITIGQFLYNQIKENPNNSLKNQIFYRQDYVDEYNKIWDTQKQYHKQLKEEHKKHIRDKIIFYQRKLKSQKHLVSKCEFETQRRVIPKSSPLFQEFKVRQILNNLRVKNLESGELFNLDQDLKESLYDSLCLEPKIVSKKILRLIVDNPDAYDLNYNEIEGNKYFYDLTTTIMQILAMEGNEINFKKLSPIETKEKLFSFCESIGINPKILLFDSSIDGNDFDKQKSMQLWHLLYAAEDDNSNTGTKKLHEKLNAKFGIPPQYASLFSNLGFDQNYSSLSARAIRKILPHLKDGLTYDKACVLAGYNHSHSETKEEKSQRKLDEKLKLLPKNALRNPVVEKIINQVVNVVNAIIDDPSMGKPDEIRIEIGRELKATKEQREDATKYIRKVTKDHLRYRHILKEEYGLKYVNRKDIIKYKLYNELSAVAYKCPYCNKHMAKKEFVSGALDIDHIIPRSRLFDDSFSNKVLSHRDCNIEKGSDTAYDYMKKKGEANYEIYFQTILDLFKNKKITKSKRDKLLMSGDKIPDDFINRDLGQTQYISKKTMEMLRKVCREVNPITGKITDRLRSDWGLIDTMKEVNWNKYDKIGLTHKTIGKNGIELHRIKDWTKRNDHRHHALDAITIAFTKKNIIQYLNNLNAKSDKNSIIYAIEQKELSRERNGQLKFVPPFPNIRVDVKKQLEKLIVSHKAKNKVVTRNTNKIKIKGKGKFIKKTELTPRGQLHKETIYGKKKYYSIKMEKIGSSFNQEKINTVANSKIKNALLKRLLENDNNPKKAFTGKNSLDNNPLFLDDQKSIEVPSKVKLVRLDDVYTIRKEITPDLVIEKIRDKGIKRIIKRRLEEYNNDPKKAFSNLKENPIWLNKEKGIAIKRVSITGVQNATPIHTKKDHLGKTIKSYKKHSIHSDYVQTGNNHHVAIYKDDKGNLKEELVSFYEAVIRKNQGVPIINREHEKGWTFLFSMKQNECFVFPNENFDPNEIDLLDPKNYSLISPNLFRVQKISSGDYFFNHHHETMAINSDTLKNKSLSTVTYIRISTPQNLKGIVKVRVNHLGKIVKKGEY